MTPNGDLFNSIKAGDTTVVTDQIDHFTTDGIALKSGEILKADIIVTAAGLNMQVVGGAAFSVDDKAVDFPGTLSYKGMMYSDVPNLIQTFGYSNASWTLRADLTSEYACRLLNHMDTKGVSQCTARLREKDMDMPARPWIEDFSAGYMQRSMHTMPKQGDKDPWRNTQNYALDKKIIRKASLEDWALVFGPTDLAQGHVNSSIEKSRATAFFFYRLRCIEPADQLSNLQVPSWLASLSHLERRKSAFVAAWIPLIPFSVLYELYAVTLY